MNKSADLPKVLVCQYGARRRYAIPRMLEEEGMLAGLYTDSTAYSLLGRTARAADKLGISHPRLKALTARVPRGVPKNKVFSSDQPLMKLASFGRKGSGSEQDFIRWGTQGAGIVYSMYGETPGFLKWARNEGLKIIVDVFVHPSTNRIVAQERRAFLNEESDTERMDAEDRHTRRVFELADILICPSEWVAEGVRSLMPECWEKVRVAPYGSSLQIKERKNSPVVGRILYAGREPLRKGLHYLAEAAHLLRKQGFELQLRSAGVSDEDVGWIRHHSELELLGTIPMNRMQEEYCCADIFVLPSLSEGQAGVVLEAMSYGCPVIVTRESGVDLNKNSGITVPARDPIALAGAIQRVVSDRQLRNELAAGAMQQAAMFSFNEYKGRLIEVIRSIA